MCSFHTYSYGCEVSANILHSGGKHFKLYFCNLAGGLQIEEEAINYRNVNLEKSWKNIQNVKSNKSGN